MRRARAAGRASTTARAPGSSVGPPTPSCSSAPASPGSSTKRATTTQTTCCRTSPGSPDRSTDLYRRGNTIIPTPQGQRLGPALAARLKADVLTGQLPKVSWILASDDDCEHPEATPNAGARFVSSVLDARTSDPEVWAKTVVFYTFDENDGFFDHVVPPTPPAGTPGEYLSAAALAKVDPSSSFGISGPVGLGFRAPMLVISPFSRGGRLCGDTFDHTSLLRFLEARFGVPVPNLSAWRRANVGDLTATLRCLARPDTAIPRLPDADALATASAAACKTKPPPAVPADQRMPRLATRRDQEMPAATSRHSSHERAPAATPAPAASARENQPHRPAALRACRHQRPPDHHDTQGPLHDPRPRTPAAAWAQPPPHRGTRRLRSADAACDHVQRALAGPRDRRCRSGLRVQQELADVSAAVVEAQCVHRAAAFGG